MSAKVTTLALVLVRARLPVGYIATALAHAYCTFLEFFLLSRLHQVWVAMRAYCTRETDSRPLALFQSVDADKDGIVVRFEMLPSFV